MTPEQERRLVKDFNRCLPAIEAGVDPAFEYPHGWLLGDKLETFIPENLSLTEVLSTVAITTRVSIAELKGSRRSREVAWPRMVCYLLMKQCCQNSTFMEIGRFLNRDHTTILIGSKRGEVLRKNRPDFEQIYQRCLHEMMG